MDIDGITVCCVFMEMDLTTTNGNRLIYWDDDNRLGPVAIHNGYLDSIAYCPWCGARIRRELNIVED